MSVFVLNVLNYINGSRAVRKVYLRYKKESYKQKSDLQFPFSFLSLFIILAIENKISRNQMKIFLLKIIERGNIKLSSSLNTYAWEKWQKNHSIQVYLIFFSLYLHSPS